MSAGAAIGWRGALARLPTPTGKQFVAAFEHGTLLLELYAPRGSDTQKPHTRDEIYVVIAGRGTFFCDGVRIALESGDALFAPAGAVHRFEDFSEDLAVWVMFYGPEGGEAASTS
ncbi:MAG TPA: cupin domain-containing protein [Rhodanobacteraceae bacterium]|jgi:mannose-6-phosphate isomerase-like protein (cupin superfamily)|nr:cupin domain-containing protein [Rhodanobacteraceae bacterium]